MGRLMGEAPETAIFRSFAALSAEDLLYRQAELIALEKDWRQMQEANRSAQDEATQDRIYNWDEIQHSENDLHAVLRIRDKLERYRKHKHTSMLINANLSSEHTLTVAITT